jgi:hypothetical protein
MTRNQLKAFNNRLTAAFWAALAEKGLLGASEVYYERTFKGQIVQVLDQYLGVYAAPGIEVEIDGVYGTPVRRVKYKITPDTTSKDMTSEDMTPQINKAVALVVKRIQKVQEAQAGKELELQALTAVRADQQAVKEALEADFKKVGFSVRVVMSEHENRVSSVTFDGPEARALLEYLIDRSA